MNLNVLDERMSARLCKNRKVSVSSNETMSKIMTIWEKFSFL